MTTTDIRRIKGATVAAFATLLLLIALFLLGFPGSAHAPPTGVILPFTAARPRLDSLRHLGTRIIMHVYRPETVRLQADVWTTTNISLLKAARILGRGPVAEREGTALWFISPEDRPQLEKLALSPGEQAHARRPRPILTTAQSLILDPVARPSIVAKEFTTASMFSGSSIPIGGTNVPVGLELSITPRLVWNRIRMELCFLYSEAVTDGGKLGAVEVRTNAAFRARVEASDGTGMFFVSAQTNRASVCFYIWSLHAK